MLLEEENYFVKAHPKSILFRHAIRTIDDESKTNV